MQVLYLARKDESWVVDGLNHYLRRLKHYTSIEMIRVNPPKASGSLSEAECRVLDSNALRTAIPPGAYIVTLDKSGQTASSEDLARMLGRLQTSSRRVVIFAIGGAYGFSVPFLKASDAVLSLSPMTFPHQLARLVFLEQLYRGFTILKGESYHHA